MRVKFRGKTLNINNELNNSNEFYSDWNYYTIEILKNDRNNYRDNYRYKEHKYYVVVSSPLGHCIVDGCEAATKSKCLQEAFDNIDIDLREMENTVSEQYQLKQDYGEEFLEDIEECEYWLSKMYY